MNISYPPDTHTYVSISAGKKYSFFGKFGVFLFLATSVLRFALLPYYRLTELTLFQTVGSNRTWNFYLHFWLALLLTYFVPRISKYISTGKWFGFTIYSCLVTVSQIFLWKPLLISVFFKHCNQSRFFLKTWQIEVEKSKPKCLTHFNPMLHCI